MTAPEFGFLLLKGDLDHVPDSWYSTSCGMYLGSELADGSIHYFFPTLVYK